MRNTTGRPVDERVAGDALNAHGRRRRRRIIRKARLIDGYRRQVLVDRHRERRAFRREDVLHVAGAIAGAHRDGVLSADEGSIQIRIHVGERRVADVCRIWCDPLRLADQKFDDCPSV